MGTVSKGWLVTDQCPSWKKLPIHLRGAVRRVELCSTGKRSMYTTSPRLNPIFRMPRRAGVALGVRTALIVPLLREGISIGAINVRRKEVRPFSEKQIQLLKTFADQAVIAIENVRLFKEIQERNAELREA